MPTRSGKSFSIVKEPQRSEEVMPPTSTQLPSRASRRGCGRPPSDAPPTQPRSESANKRVRKGKKERIREMLAHMQRHVIDSTPLDNPDQIDHNKRLRCNIGRGRSGKLESVNQVSSEPAADPISKECENELRTSPQARLRDIHAVDQMGANGQVKKKAEKKAMKERKRENKEKYKKEQKKQRRKGRQAQVAQIVADASIVFSIAEAKQPLAHDSHITPTYDLQTGEHIAWPVMRSYHLGAVGRYV
jgi:hypothetical protein